MLFDRNNRETNLTSSQKRGLNDGPSFPGKKSIAESIAASSGSSTKPTTKPPTPTTTKPPTTPTTPTTPTASTPTKATPPKVVPKSNKWEDIVSAYFPDNGGQPYMRAGGAVKIHKKMAAGGLVRGGGKATKGLKYSKKMG